MSSDETTPAEKAVYEAWRAEQKAKRDAKIAARVQFLRELGSPLLPSGVVVGVDGYATPNEDTEDVLLRLIEPRGVPDAREGQDPLQYVIDVTLESDGVLYRIDVYSKTAGVYKPVAVAVLDSIHTVSRHGFGKRVIAIYNVAETDDGDEMEAINYF